MSKSAMIRVKIKPKLKRDAEPITSVTFTDLASLYKRLDELDEWRRFAYDLAQMKLRP